MNITSRNFGQIEVKEQDIIKFKVPIFGFDDYSRFVLLYDDEIGNHFAWLQSIEESELCFILTDPQIVPIPYPVTVPNEIYEKIGFADCDCWLISVIAEDFNQSTVNLKSPVFINQNTHFAAQAILEEDFPIKFPLIQSEEGQSC